MDEKIAHKQYRDEAAHMRDLERRTNQGYAEAKAGYGIPPPDRPLTEVERAERILALDDSHKRLAQMQNEQMQVAGVAFIASMGQVGRGIRQWMQHQGFWESNNKGEKLALIHSEISECLEAVRKEDSANEGEELADAVIRIMDYADRFGFDLGQCIIDKMRKNYNRPFKHGKVF